VKTAVSLPESLFKEAERMARRLGIPRSQLFARALEEFIRSHDRRAITERLDEIYDGAVTTEDRFLDSGLGEMRKATKNDTW
jgi:metal-responsive CopG/Arc/MetJ family transcriptional regulator